MNATQRNDTPHQPNGQTQALALFAGLLLLLLVLLLGQPAPVPFITVENVGQLREVARFQNDDTGYAFRHLAISPSGQQLLVSSGYNNYLWNLVDGTQSVMRLNVAGGYTPHILFADERPIVAFANWVNTMMFLDMPGGQPFRTVENVGQIPHGWGLSADGRLTATTSDITLSVIDVETGERHFENSAPADHAYWYSIPTFNDDATWVATSYRNWACRCDDDRGKDEVVLWDSATGEQVMNLGQFTDGAVWAFDFSDDNRLLAVGGGSFIEKGGQLQLWDLSTGEQLIHTLTGGLSIEQIRISPDNRSLAAQGYGTVWLWNIDDAIAGEAPLMMAEGDGNSRDYNGITFSQDGKLFASGTPEGDVLIYDTANGQVVARLEGQARQINQVSFSEDGRSLAAISNNTALVWSLSQPRRTTPVEGSAPTPVQTMPDILTPTVPASG